VNSKFFSSYGSNKLTGQFFAMKSMSTSHRRLLLVAFCDEQCRRLEHRSFQSESNCCNINVWAFIVLADRSQGIPWRARLQVHLHLSFQGKGHAQLCSHCSGSIQPSHQNLHNQVYPLRKPLFLLPPNDSRTPRWSCQPRVCRRRRNRCEIRV
jgi:hypothetical protein